MASRSPHRFANGPDCADDYNIGSWLLSPTPNGGRIYFQHRYSDMDYYTDDSSSTSDQEPHFHHGPIMVRSWSEAIDDFGPARTTQKVRGHLSKTPSSVPSSISFGAFGCLSQPTPIPGYVARTHAKRHTSTGRDSTTTLYRASRRQTVPRHVVASQSGEKLSSRLHQRVRCLEAAPSPDCQGQHGWGVGQQLTLRRIFLFSAKGPRQSGPAVRTPTRTVVPGNEWVLWASPPQSRRRILGRRPGLYALSPRMA